MRERPAKPCRQVGLGLRHRARSHHPLLHPPSRHCNEWLRPGKSENISLSLSSKRRIIFSFTRPANMFPFTNAAGRTSSSAPRPSATAGPARSVPCAEGSRASAENGLYVGCPLSATLDADGSRTSADEVEPTSSEGENYGCLQDVPG